MARRQTPVLRNLDDPLKVLSFLTLRSCGLVLMFFSGLYAAESLFGLVSLVFGSWAFLVELGASAVVAAILGMAEKADDEYLVPSAIRYYLGRPWAVLYGGAAVDHFRGHEIEWVFDGPRRAR